MGGMVKLYLKDTSIENIKKHNDLLRKCKVKKSINFYSEEEVLFEYQSFMKGVGHFPEHLFPSDKIKTFEDFKRYWNTESLGEVFCPKFGSLLFDCYFGRTSDNAMKCIKNYIVQAIIDNFPYGSPFKEAGGSWDTFLERCSASKLKLELINENVKYKY